MNYSNSLSNSQKISKKIKDTFWTAKELDIFLNRWLIRLLET